MARRHDIDFIRVVVFGLLMIYHTSLIFGTRGWLVHADIPSRAFDVISLASHPWRISLLFFIAGITTAALSQRCSPSEIRNQRSRQLIPPLLFGIFVLVPPQIYIVATSDLGLDMGYLDFWGLYMRFGAISDPAGGSISVVSMQHLWFLAYLWLYTAVLTVLMANCVGGLDWLSQRLRSWLSGYGLFVWPILCLAALRLFLYPLFGETMNAISDWYSHVVYFSFFTFGFLMAYDDSFWTLLVERRYHAAAGAGLSLIAILLLFIFYPPEARGMALMVLHRIIRSALQWFAVVAILGFCRVLITRPNRVISYLNRAMLSYYVLHQTVLLMVAYWLKQLIGFDASSFVTIVVTSTVCCAVLYELQTRSIGLLRRIRQRLVDGDIQPSAP